MASARLATAAVLLLVLVSATGTHTALGCSHMPNATSSDSNSPVAWISSKIHDLLDWLHVTSPRIAPRMPNAAEPSSTAASDVAAAPNDGGSSSDDTPDFADGDDATVRNHWALLVAGSNGWWNYRHQADVSHAYQVLIGAGFKAQHIVVMAYDDIAHAAENPHAGTVVNRPGGPNVYRGLKIDYRGEDVNAATFLAVLAGDAKAVRNAGNGRVIASGPHDRLFVFYSDHGSTGVLGMPTGPFLFADDLMSTLLRKRRSGGFHEAVLYIEACESGSMFEGLLPDDDGEGIYVTTASNAVESSWGTYCPGVDDHVPAEYSTCLGDLYSVAWMENAEVSDLSHETLKMQYDLVRRRTSNNDTFIMGSHVMQYGAYRAMQPELAGDYLGMRNKTVAPAVTAERANRRMLQAGAQQPLQEQQQQQAGTMHRTVEQRDADLVHWRHEAKWAKDESKRAAAKARLDAAVSARQRADQAAGAVVEQLLHQKSSSQALLAFGGWTAPQVYLRPMALTSPIGSGISGASNMLRVDPRVIDAIVSSPVGRPAAGVPAVDDWGCLRGMVGAWGRACGPMDQYSMKHTRLLANLCNAGLTPADVEAALAASGCSEPAAAVDAAAAVAAS